MDYEPGVRRAGLYSKVDTYFDFKEVLGLAVDVVKRLLLVLVFEDLTDWLEWLGHWLLSVLGIWFLVVVAGSMARCRLLPPRKVATLDPG